MTRIVIKKLSWDEYNKEHIKKHNVSVIEAEYVAKHLIAHKKAKKGRYLLFGRAGSRIITVVVRREKANIYYPVSARDSAKKERRQVYEKEKRHNA